MASTWLSTPDLVDLIGEDAAIRLCQEYGGLCVYITKRPETSKLVPTIGHVAAESLCAAFGGEEIMLPALIRRPQIKEKIVVLLRAGVSYAEIARECRCSYRHVAGIAGNTGLSVRKRAQAARSDDDAKA